jgi:cell wall-associated NlpC family hydrolase
MPWPPTEATDFQIPIEWQLSAGSTPGLESDQLVGTESTSLLDASTGAMAPNALNVYDNPLDILEQIEQQQKAQRQALAPEGAEGKRQQVIELAKQKLGMNYVWGGESDAEGGYDCSGLLWWAFKEAGISMPRVSMAQAERGKRVPISELKPGDLVAWENNPAQRGADHIALYLGDGQILEAPRTGLKVRIRKLSSAELQNLSRTWGVKLDY